MSNHFNMNGKHKEEPDNTVYLRTHNKQACYTTHTEVKLSFIAIQKIKLPCTLEVCSSASLSLVPRSFYQVPVFHPPGTILEAIHPHWGW